MELLIFVPQEARGKVISDNDGEVFEDFEKLQNTCNFRNYSNSGNLLQFRRSKLNCLFDIQANRKMK